MHYHQLSRIEHWSESQPRIIGDSRDLVAILCLDIQGLEFIVNELETHAHSDEFTKELRKVLDEIIAEKEVSHGQD